MSTEKFDSRDMLVKMVQHYETLLISSSMMESEHPFIDEAFADIAKIKKHFGNRCFLCTSTIDELIVRDHMEEEEVENEQE
jgi:PP-loop superfamily ATP-utilizing enzyme